MLPRNRYDVLMMDIAIATRIPCSPPMTCSPYKINPTRIGLRTYLIAKIKSNLKPLNKLTKVESTQ